MNTRFLNRLIIAAASILIPHTALTAAAGDEAAFVRCTAEKKVMQRGEGCRIILSVYTPTWFAGGVEFPQADAGDGVILKSDRTRTATEYVGGKRFSKVYQEYAYYPLKDGQTTVRFLPFQVRTFDSSTYKEQDVTLVPPEIRLTADFRSDAGITAARRLKASQRLDIPDTLYAGDIIYREIDIEAEGVPAAFIVLPESAGEIASARVYAETPRYSTDVSGGTVRSKAVQGLSYLLSEPGPFIIPDIEIPYVKVPSGKTDTLVLKGTQVEVMQCGQSPAEAVDKRPERRMTALAAILTSVLAAALLYAAALLIRASRDRKRLTGVLQALFFKSKAAFYDRLYLYAAANGFSSFLSMAAVYGGRKAEGLYRVLEEALFSPRKIKVSGIWKAKMTAVLTAMDFRRRKTRSGYR